MNRIILAFCAVFVALPAWAASEIEEFTTPGGIEVWLVNEPSIPIVALEVSFKGGTSLDVAGKEGATYMMAGLLEEGAGDLNALIEIRCPLKRRCLKRMSGKRLICFAWL